MTATAERSLSGSPADKAPQRPSHGLPAEWCMDDEVSSAIGDAHQAPGARCYDGEDGALDPGAQARQRECAEG